MEGITGAVTIYFCRNCLCGFPAYLFIENKKRSAGLQVVRTGGVLPADEDGPRDNA